MVVLVKRHRKRSDNISGKGITPSVRRVTTKSADQETDHQCVFQNPTYQSNVTTTGPMVTVKPADEDNNFPEHALQDDNDCIPN